MMLNVLGTSQEDVSLIRNPYYSRLEQCASFCVFVISHAALPSCCSEASGSALRGNTAAQAQLAGCAVVAEDAARELRRRLLSYSLAHTFRAATAAAAYCPPPG